MPPGNPSSVRARALLQRLAVVAGAAWRGSKQQHGSKMQVAGQCSETNRDAAVWGFKVNSKLF
jgi:hypothetical protein